MFWNIELIKIVIFAVLIWVAAGLVIRAVSKLALQYHLSKFLFSFMILGILTSTPEIFISFGALRSNNLQIFVGNLLGASIVLISLLLPILVISKGKLAWENELSYKKLFATCAVISLPGIFIFNGKLGMIEGMLLMCAYALMVTIFDVKKKLVEKLEKKVNRRDWKVVRRAIFELILGVGLMIICADAIVKEIVIISNASSQGVYFISLIFVSLMTNAPELSLIIKSALSKGSSVAIGDLLGSAATNTFLLGMFLVLAGKSIILTNNYILVSIAFLGMSTLLLFYAKRNQYFDKKFGFAMLGIYVLFIFFELNWH